MPMSSPKQSKPAGPLDMARLVAEVAARHGFLIRQDDPAMAIVTMNQLALEQSMEFLEKRMRCVVRDIEERLQRKETDVLDRIEEASRSAAAAVKEDIQRDLERGNLHARELIIRLQKVYARPSARFWTSCGMVLAVLLFLAGIVIGHVVWH